VQHTVAGAISGRDTNNALPRQSVKRAAKSRILRANIVVIAQRCCEHSAQRKHSAQRTAACECCGSSNADAIAAASSDQRATAAERIVRVVKPAKMRDDAKFIIKNY
jgi:hypothetical protein